MIYPGLKSHLPDYIHHLDGLVQGIIQVVDNISWIGQNKNIVEVIPFLSTFPVFFPKSESAGGCTMALEFLEYEDSPFVFDKESWETFSMGGSSRDKWRKVADSDIAFRIRSNSSVISELEAKALADALAAERAEEARTTAP